MKKTFLTLIAATFSIGIFAQENYEETMNDTARIESFDEIIASESKYKSEKDLEAHYNKVWGRNTFFNISQNTTNIRSNELPTTDGVYSDKYENSFGIGLQWGHTYNFHKRALGSVVFIGLDYSWLDLNVNRFKETEPADAYNLMGNGEDDRTMYNMPWHHEKWSADYGMSIGPSLTLYPFTALKKSGTDNIRLQFYYHIGYSVGMMFFSDVFITKEDDKSTKSTEFEWGHGLFNSFGFNLTWKFVGLGYESRVVSNYRYKSINNDFKTGTVKLKQTTNRFYLQFRF